MTKLNTVPSRDYTRNTGKWKLMRDVRDGQDAMHNAGERYLPKSPAQTKEKYDSYLARAEFYNATDRTIQGLVGMAFRKEPKVESTASEEMLEDVTTKAQNLDTYARHVLDEVLTTGRCGTLVDYPPVDASLSVGAARDQNARATMAFYAAEDIINWRFEKRGASYSLVKITLREEVLNEEGTDTHNQFRVLSIDKLGFYLQELFKENGEIILPEFNPLIGSEKFTEIPFIFHTETESGDEIQSPPMYDLATINVSHYQLKADHAHALHYVAMPTPYATGVEATEHPEAIGPDQFWGFSSSEAKVGLVEFTGLGLGAIENEVKAKEDRMASLGARVISGDPVVKETATAAGISFQSETSLLMRSVEGRSEELTKALRIFLKWNGAEDEDASFDINKDFMPKGLEPQELMALVNSWVQGAISKETLFINLKNGEVVPGDADFEEEESKIETQLPPAQNDGLGGNDGP